MTHRTFSDRQLLDRYRQGDREAIEILLNRHRRRVLDYIHMMVRDRDTAQDIYQETLIKVMQFIDRERYVDNGKFVSWMLRIAHNQAIDHFRRLKQENTTCEASAGYDILSTARFSDHTVEDAMVGDQIVQDVRKLVASLPEEQKEVVEMRYYRGMSFRDIADVTGVSINTALGRMRYALINMRKTIDEKQLVLV